MNQEINSIMVNSKVSIREAKILYQQRNPEISYASVVSQNLPQNRQQTQIEDLQKQIQQIQEQLKQQMHKKPVVTKSNSTTSASTATKSFRNHS
jgi:hypothetical protein